MSFIGNQWVNQITTLTDAAVASSCANGFPTINASSTGMTANSNTDTLRLRTEGFLVTTVTNQRTLTIAATSDLKVSQNTARVAANTWTQQNGPAAEDITWSPELGIFVAVYINNSSTSPDGIHWTTRGAIGINQETRSVTWSPELGIFVAVGSASSSRVASSPDGITWTNRTSSANNEWNAVTWVKELGLFVASSNGWDDSGSDRTKMIMTSPDGITWTGRSQVNLDGCEEIAWSKELGLLVVLGKFGTFMTSSDGITWADYYTGNSSEHYSVAWSPTLKLFVSVGNVVRSSIDGFSWVTGSFPASVSFLWKVLWVPQLEAFVAISSQGTYRGAISYNGTTWTSLPGVPATIGWDSFAWSPELGIFVAVSDATVHSSRPVGLWGAINTRLTRSQIMSRLSLGA